MPNSAQEVLSGSAPWSVDQGDSLAWLRTLPDATVQCVVTSPPYFGLRSYLPSGSSLKSLEKGLERLHDCSGWATGDRCGACYVCVFTEVFREVRRVLRPDGTLWLNVADSYSSGDRSGHGVVSSPKQRSSQGTVADGGARRPPNPPGLKSKDLCMIPARLALSLQADGWTLRQEVCLTKLSPMPESVRDRPSRATEKLYLFSRGPKYYYDQDAERVAGEPSYPRQFGRKDAAAHGLDKLTGNMRPGVTWEPPGGRNLWDWWNDSTEDIPPAVQEWKTEPSALKHYASYPTWLPRRCLRLGSSLRGCCPSCGSPWKRVTEREQKKRERPTDYVKRTGEEGTGNSCANTVAGVSVTTTGWAPSCSCPAHQPVPCVVLDPFTGTGTTGAVARDLGMRFVGCDLSPEYAQMARERIGKANPLLDACDLAGSVSRPEPSLFEPAG